MQDVRREWIGVERQRCIAPRLFVISETGLQGQIAERQSIAQVSVVVLDQVIVPAGTREQGQTLTRVAAALREIAEDIRRRVRADGGHRSLAIPESELQFVPQACGLDEKRAVRTVGILWPARAVSEVPAVINTFRVDVRLVFAVGRIGRHERERAEHV